MTLVLIPALIVISSAAAYAAADPLPRFEYDEIAMGVRARIVVYAPEEKAVKACRTAYDRIAVLEEIMSDYRPDSEIMRLCAKAGGPAVSVSKDLLYILSVSQKLSQKSNGAFDVTVGPLVKLWRKARKSGVIPADDEIKAAQSKVGWKKLHIDSKSSKVRLDVSGMQLDLGGIAKGYACDEAMKVLKANGICSALIEMGGDIVVSNSPPGKSGWEIEVANAPDPAKRQMILSNAAVSSSGDTEQYVEINGKRYSHIVDPKTGLGLTERIAVTVVAQNGTTSDGLSTAISVMGEGHSCSWGKFYPGVKVYIRRPE